MFTRSINKNDVISSLENGEIIIEYRDEEPLPCYLILNFINEKPLHIVVAVDSTKKSAL